MTITIEDARTALVDYALSCVGLSAHPKNDPARFGRVVCPYGPPAWAQSLCAPTPSNGANSTCEVFAVATDQAVAQQLGLLGLVRPLEGAVKQWGWYVEIAKRLDAYRTIAKDGPPTIGSIVRVEGPDSRHWYRPIVGTPGSGLFTSVDGGQNDRGYQAVAKCTREIRGAYEYVLPPGQTVWVRGRPVGDWIDSPALLVALAGQGSSTATSSPGTIPQRSPDPPAITQPATSRERTAVDLSAAQFARGVPDWRALGQAAGIGWARACLGLGTPDATCRIAVPGMLGAGMLAGVYGVPWPRHNRPQDAYEQALELASVHRELRCNLAPMVDFEPVADGGATPLERLQTLLIYVGTLIEQGLPPVVYIGLADLQALFKAHPELAALATRPLMLAAYVKERPRPPTPWSKISVWQRLGSAPGFVGSLPGVKGAVDVSEVLVPLDDLRA